MRHAGNGHKSGCFGSPMCLAIVVKEDYSQRYLLLYYTVQIVLTVFKKKSRCIPGSGEI
jgi:hypothetical protein